MRQAVVDLVSQPVRNLCPTPRPTSYPGDLNVMGGSIVTAAPWGTKAVQSSASGVGTQYAFSARALSSFKQGETVSGRVKLLLPVGFNYKVSIHIRSTNTYLNGSTTSTPTPSDGNWFEATATFILDRDVAAGDLDLAVLMKQTSNSAPPAGTLMTVADPIFDRTSTPPSYADGDTPGWRWTGTANASESVGYPYTLASIVGQPVAEIIGDTGNVSVPLSVLPALAGRTTYCVSDRALLNNTGGAILHAHSVPQGVTQTGHMRTSGANGAYEFRPQFVGGGGAGAAYGLQVASVIPAAGTRNIHAVAQIDGLTAFEQEVNGSATVSKTGMDAGSGYSESAGITVNRGTVSTVLYEAPVYTVQFKGFHSRETRLRVAAWLGRKYGSPVPAGY